MRIIKILGLCAAPLLLLAACGDSSDSANVRTLEDYKDATAADSLIYYYGQLQADSYWQYARRDTTLNTRESRDEFIRGLKAGLDAAKENDAYNQGLYTGIQLAMEMKEMHDEFDINFNNTILVNAIADGLINDSIIDAGEANAHFREITASFQQKREEAERAKATEALAEVAKKNGWTKINDDLYAGKASAPGAGATLTKGDQIALSMSMKKFNGEEIDRVTDRTVNVGEVYAGAVAQALLTLKYGESRVFYSNAISVYGNYARRYGLKPGDILVITLGVRKPQAQPEAE